MRFNPSFTEEMQHEEWVSYMLAAGWRHGLDHDYERRTHPALVAFHELEAGGTGEDRDGLSAEPAR
jgi:hypothetical protein